MQSRGSVVGVGPLVTLERLSGGFPVLRAWELLGCVPDAHDIGQPFNSRPVASPAVAAGTPTAKLRGDVRPDVRHVVSPVTGMGERLHDHCNPLGSGRP